MFRSTFRYLLPLSLLLLLSACNVYDYQPKPQRVWSSNAEQPLYQPNPVWKGPSDPLFSSGKMQPTNPAAKNVNPAMNPVAPVHGKGFNPSTKPLKPSNKPMDDKKHLLGE